MNSTENAQTGIWQGMSIGQYLRDLQKQIEKYSDAMNKTIQKYLQQKSREFDRSILDSAQVNQVLFREFDGTCKTLIRFQLHKIVPIIQPEIQNTPSFSEKQGIMLNEKHVDAGVDESNAEDELKLCESILQAHSIKSLEIYRTRKKKSEFCQKYESEGVLESVVSDEARLFKNVVVGTLK